MDVPAAYLGKEIKCGACRAAFVAAATPPASVPPPPLVPAVTPGPPPLPVPAPAPAFRNPVGLPCGDCGITKEEVDSSLADWVEELKEEVEELRSQRILRKKPTAAQLKEIKSAARSLIEREDYPDVETLLKGTCADCFQSVVFSHPDQAEEAISILNGWTETDNFEIDCLFLSDADDTDLNCIQDLLKKPTPEQLAEAIAAVPTTIQSENDTEYNKALLASLTRLYPDLIKKSAKVQAYFKAGDGCFSLLIGLAVVAPAIPLLKWCLLLG